MPMDPVEIERLIKEALPDAEIKLEDLVGDGDHWSATVVSSAFVGKTRVQQHQLIPSRRALLRRKRPELIEGRERRRRGDWQVKSDSRGPVGKDRPNRTAAAHQRRGVRSRTICTHN